MNQIQINKPSSFIEGQNRLINQLKSNEIRVCLNKRIVNTNSFVGAVVSGQRQSGKSMYMLIALYELYNHDWDEVFKHIFFDMEHFTEYLNEALETGIRVPCIAIDDAGVHFGAQQWNIHRNQVTFVTALLDTIGIITKSIILTVPSSSNLIKAIRSANFYNIEIKQGRNKYDRQAHGYLMHTSPKGQIYPSKEFIDYYDVRVPNHIYERYALLRRKYSVDTLKDMKTFMGEKQKQVFKSGNNKYCEIEVDD